MITIKFVEDKSVLDGEGNVTSKFKSGQVVELSTASARHWLNRGAALEVQARAKVELKTVYAPAKNPAPPNPTPRKPGRPKLSSV